MSSLSWPSRIVTAGTRPITSPASSDALGVGRLERDLPDVDVGRLDELARRDRLDGHDDRDPLEASLAGPLLGLVDERTPRARDDGEDDATTTMELTARVCASISTNRLPGDP